MTQEEKARAYDEALEKAKIRYDNNPTDGYVGYANLILKELFPQLHESEGERIRKELIQYLKDYPTNLPNGQYTRADFFAYLEKQKEQKPVDYDHEMWKNCEANFEGGKKEVIEHPERYGLQKPAEWGEEEKKFIKHCAELLDGQGEPMCALRLESLPERFSIQPKQEWSEEEERHLYNAIEAVKYVYDISEGTNGFKCVEFLKSLRPQPKQEWGEEDEKTIDEAVEYIEKYAEYVQGGFSKQYVLDVARRVDSLRPQPKQEWGEGDENKLYQVVETLLADKAIALRENPHCKALHRAYDELIDWLKSLPKRFNLQPKQEWSEEDEEHLDSIIESYKELLKDYSANHGVDYIPYNTPIVARTVLNDINFLKSLCPQPKREWSKEDKDKIEDILLIIKHAANIPYSGGILTINNEYKDELSKFLKSFVPNAEN